MLTIRATTLAGVIAQVDLLDELAAFHPDCDDEDCQPLLEIIRTGLVELLGHAA